MIPEDEGSPGNTSRLYLLIVDSSIVNTSRRRDVGLVVLACCCQLQTGDRRCGLSDQQRTSAHHQIRKDLKEPIPT